MCIQYGLAPDGLTVAVTNIGWISVSRPSSNKLIFSLPLLSLIDADKFVALLPVTEQHPEIIFTNSRHTQTNFWWFFVCGSQSADKQLIYGLSRCFRDRGFLAVARVFLRSIPKLFKTIVISHIFRKFSQKDWQSRWRSREMMGDWLRLRRTGHQVTIIYLWELCKCCEIEYLLPQ